MRPSDRAHPGLAAAELQRGTRDRGYAARAEFALGYG